MAHVIRMQSFKDWKDGLITTEELLQHKTYYREPAQVVAMWEKIFAHNSDKYQKSGIDWSKVPHHHLCCCDRCAPTKEDVQRKVERHNEELTRSAGNIMADQDMPEIDHSDMCCCNQCLEDMERGLYEGMDDTFENLAPSDC